MTWLRKSAAPRGLAGVCLTPGGLAAAAVQRTEGQPPRLLHCEYQALGGKAERAQSLRRLLAHEALRQRPVTTTLCSGEFSLQMLDAPDVSDDELRPAVRWRIKDLLDFDVEQAVLDVFPVPGQKERGRTPLVYVVAARKQTVRGYVDELTGAGAALAYIDIPELAQRNLSALLDEDARGVALLSLDANSGLLTLTRGGVLYLARSLDVGYRNLLPHQGDAPESGGLQLEAGMSPEQQRGFDSIVLEVQRSLDYFESHFGLPPISQLVIAPLAQDVPGILTYMGGQLGLPVRQLDLNDVLDVATPLDQATQAHSLLAIGAALRSVS